MKVRIEDTQFPDNNYEISVGPETKLKDLIENIKKEKNIKENIQLFYSDHFLENPENKLEEYGLKNMPICILQMKRVEESDVPTQKLLLTEEKHEIKAEPKKVEKQKEQKEQKVEKKEEQKVEKKEEQKVEKQKEQQVEKKEQKVEEKEEGEDEEEDEEEDEDEEEEDEEEKVGEKENIVLKSEKLSIELLNI